MIRNQDEHELEIGSFEIADSKDSFVLAITGSRNFEPSVIITPLGANANLNTFVAMPCEWGTIHVSPDVIPTYDLTKVWTEKDGSTEYPQRLVDGLMLWMRLNDGGGETAATGIYNDSSTHGNNASQGAALDRPAPDSSAPLGTDGTTKYIQQKSQLFDGDYITGTRSGGAGWDGVFGNANFEWGGTPLPFTIAFWWKTEAGESWGQGEVVMRFGSLDLGNNATRQIVCNTTTPGRFRFMWGTGTFVSNAGTPFSGTENDWHHIVITRDNSSTSSDGRFDNPAYSRGMKFYVDGVVQVWTFGGGRSVDDMSATDITQFKISADSSSLEHVHLADVAVWNVELTAAEVNTIYKASKKGIASGTTYTGDYWWTVIKRSTSIGDVTVQYQAIGASPLRVK